MSPKISFQSATGGGDDGAAFEPVVTPFDWTISDFESAVNRGTMVLLEARATAAEEERSREQGAKRVSEGTSEVVPEPAAPVVSEGTSEVVPEPAAPVVSEGTSEVVPEPAAPVVSEGTSEVVPEPAAPVVSEGTSEVVPEPAAPVVAVVPPVQSVCATMAELAVAVAVAPTPSSMPRPPSIKFDVILLTDCIFSVSLARPLVDILRHYSDKTTTVYCCHEIRDADANALFVAELSKHFRVKRIPYGKLHPDYRTKFIQLLQAKLLRG